MWKPPSGTWNGKKEIHPAIRFLQYSNKAVFIFRLSWIANTAVIAAVFDQIHFHLNTNTNNAVLFAAFEFVDIQMEKLPSAFHLTVITSNCAFSVTYLLTLLSLSPSFAYLD